MLQGEGNATEQQHGYEDEGQKPFPEPVHCSIVANPRAARLQEIPPASIVPIKNLAPANGTLPRYRLQEWLGFISSEIHKSFSLLFNPAMPEEAKKIYRDRLASRYGWLDGELAAKQYLGKWRGQSGRWRQASSEPSHCAGGRLCRTSAVVEATTERNTPPNTRPHCTGQGVRPLQIRAHRAQQQAVGETRDPQ